MRQFENSAYCIIQTDGRQTITLHFLPDTATVINRERYKEWWKKLNRWSLEVKKCYQTLARNFNKCRLIFKKIISPASLAVDL